MAPAELPAVSVAWIAYLPIPGLALIPRWMEPHERSARFHSWQGGVLVGLLWLLLVLIGLLGRASDAEGFGRFIGLMSLLVILAYVAGAVMGAVAAARGRFVRIRPVYDLLVLLRI